MNTKVIQFFDEQHKKELLLLYHNAWWSKERTAKDVDTILSNSSFYIGIVTETTNQLIAFSRVLTDYFQFSYIYDVIVHEPYRGYGLGKKLIEAIINHPNLKDIKNIELVCRKEMIPFYSQFGFTEDYQKSIPMILQKS
jgi:predicted GNAT family N-acyltransferase